MSDQTSSVHLSIAAEESVMREKEIDAVLARWDAGERADALAVLEESPHLAAHRSAVVTLAYEEYCQRVEEGQTVEVEPFVAQFGPHHTAIRKVLAIHHLELDARTVPEKLTIGSPFKNFMIVDRLGAGAFSNVYLAVDLEMGNRATVLKLTTMPGNEPEVLGKLQCPHIVPGLNVVGTGVRGPTVIAMPFFGPATFEDLLTARRVEANPDGNLILKVAARAAALPASDPPLEMPDRYAARPFDEGAVWLLRGIADGLAKAHQKNYSHLDLKPSNILLAKGGCPMLADFNLSLGSDERTATVGGTVPYMAPEQLRRFIGREGPEVSFSADVYSLGVIAHELLCGGRMNGPVDVKLPPYQLAGQLLEQLEGAPSPSVSAPGLNRSLRRLIAECLQVDPQARPTAAEVRRRLTSELEAYAVSARAVARHPRRSLAAVGLFVAVLIAASAGISRLPSAEDRYYASAVTAYREDDFDSSLEYTKLVLAANPSHLGAITLQVDIALDRGNFSDAVELLEARIAKFADVGLNSRYAYACIKSNRRSDGISVLQRLSGDGYRTPANLNNLAYAHIRQGDIDEARRLLGDPLLSDVREAAVLFNKANVELIVAQRTSGYVPSQALSDAEDAEELAGPHGDSSFVVALLRSFVAGGADKDAENIIRDLRRAIENGYPKATVYRERRFASLQTRPDFQELNTLTGDDGRQTLEKMIRPR